MFESAPITTTIQSPSYADATASTSMASPPRFAQPQRALGDQRRTPNSTTPEARAELRSQWVKATRAAAAIAEALRRDPLAAFGPACDLNLALESLWKLRKHRDDDNWVVMQQNVGAGLFQPFNQPTQAISECGENDPTQEDCDF